MALTVIKRPQGHVLDSTEVSACIYNDYGDAIVFSAGHGLETGDTVFIKSNVSDYNGFWYVVYNNGGSFYLREYATASNLDGIVDTCDVTYWKAIKKHGFQCVHLPIVYKLRSNLYPTNEVDTSRTISSITDANGLCNLNLSGSLGTFDELEYVKISSNTDFPDEVYQVTDKVSTSDITINRVYEAGLSTAGTIILYYNNYTVYIKIKAGLYISPFSTLQPFEEVTVLKLVPDANNIVTVNIAEILKTKMRVTENDTLAATLPNNIDFYTQSYIEYGETYDDAVAGEVVESTLTYSEDLTFRVHAVNAMLPFKNRYSGFMSEYIYGSSSALQKFLSVFSTPILFSGEYFDISFINQFNTSSSSADLTSLQVRLKREVYIDDVLKEVFYDSISPYGSGVFRKQIEVSGWSEDRIDLTLEATSTYDRENVNYKNNGGSDWLLPNLQYAERTVTTTGNFTLTSNKVITPVNIVSGVNYNWKLQISQLSLELDITGGTTHSGTLSVYLRYYDASFVQTDSVLVTSITRTTTGVTSSNFDSVASLTATSNASYIGFVLEYAYTRATPASSINHIYSCGSVLIQNEYSYFITASETKSITVNTDCSSQNIYLGWLNYLGGFEYWNFTARKDYRYETSQSKITEKNIYTNWPNSYGEFANSITKQIARESRKKIIVRSQFLTSDQIEAIKYIRFSPLVQIIEDKYNVTNVVVDAGSFKTFTDAQDLNTIQFTISFTDKIPSQFE